MGEMGVGTGVAGLEVLSRPSSHLRCWMLSARRSGMISWKWLARRSSSENSSIFFKAITMTQEGWTLKPLAVNKSINLGTKNLEDNLNSYLWSHHCSYLHCVIKAPSVQLWFVYFFLSVQPLYTNFDPNHWDRRDSNLGLLGEKQEC